MQKTAWHELVLKPWTISCTPRSGRPGRGRKRPLVWATSRPTIGIDVLIVPHPRHALPGTVGSPEYKDGTSMAAPEPKMRLGRSGSRRAGRRGSGVIPGQTQAYTAL